MIRSYLLVVINSVVVATFTVSLVTFFINGPTFIANQPTPSPSCIDPSSFDHFPAPPNLSCISLSEISANTDNILIYSAWQNLSFYFVINSCLLCLFILLHDFKVLNGKGHTIWTVKKASHGFSSVLYSPIVFFWNFNHGNFVSFLCKFIAIIISPVIVVLHAPLEFLTIVFFTITSPFLISFINSLLVLLCLLGLSLGFLGVGLFFVFGPGVNVVPKDWPNMNCYCWYPFFIILCTFNWFYYYLF